MNVASARPGKKERRQYYRELQNSFPAALYAEWNRGLSFQLKKLLQEIKEGSLVAVYHAKAKEADLSSLFSLPYRFCFPKVLERNGIMEFREVKKALDPASFQKGAWDILEPLATFPIRRKEEMAACFVPLLALDQSGMRLGQGKGFYDRFLENFQGRRFGAAFEWQISPEALPTESCDQGLEAVATEQRILRFSH